MCFKSGAVAYAPPIVRDESSRVFLGGALQQSPPLRRPSSMVGQFSLEVNSKDEPAPQGGRCRRRENRRNCCSFIPAPTPVRRRQDNATAQGQRLRRRGGMDELVESATDLSAELHGERSAGHAPAYQKLSVL